MQDVSTMSTDGNDLKELLLPHEGEDKYSAKYIYRQIFGTLMKGHHQRWPEIDFSVLKKLNADTVGWIHMNNSPINYPVVKGRPDPGYYLSHNFSGEPSFHGAVAMDHRNDGALGDFTTILTAHHMKDRSMFFPVARLHSWRYYVRHREFDFLMEDGMYRARIFAAHYISSKDPEPVRVTFDSRQQYAAWLKERKKKSAYPTFVRPKETDRVIVLVTCTCIEEPDDRRDEIAVYAVLRKA